MPVDLSNLSWAVSLALLCAAVETVEQLLYRIAGRNKQWWWSTISAAFVLHVTYLVIWLLLLRRVPLSTALPLMGLQYVTIALAAKLIFNERVDTRRWMGICVIVLGFVLVAANLKD